MITQSTKNTESPFKAIINPESQKAATRLIPDDNVEKNLKPDVRPEQFKNIDFDTIGFYRIWDITGCKKRGVKALLPIGRSTFLQRVKEGVYPAPYRLSEKTVAWKKTDILALIAELGGQK